MHLRGHATVRSTKSWIRSAGVMKSTSRNFDTVIVGEHMIWMISHCLAILKPTDILSLSWRTWFSPNTTKKELEIFIFLCLLFVLTNMVFDLSFWCGREQGLELGKILITNFHPSCEMTFYISFQVNDPSDNQTNPIELWFATFLEILKWFLAIPKKVVEFCERCFVANLTTSLLSVPKHIYHLIYSIYMWSCYFKANKSVQLF